jgi:replicative DNA helicase
MTTETPNVREREIVGGLLSDPNAGRPHGLFETVRGSGIGETDLRDPFARLVLETVTFCHEQHIAPTIENVAEAMLHDGKYTGSYDELVALLGEMSRRAPRDPNMLAYLCGSLLERREHEKIINFLTRRAPQIASGGLGTAAQVWDEVNAEWEKLRPDFMEAAIYSLDEQAQYISRVEREQAKKIGTKMLTLPNEFDEVASTYLPWLEPNNLYVIAGRPGSGKSTVMDQIAEHNARAGFVVAYFHLEDSTTRKLWRRTMRLTGCTLAELKAGDPRGMIAKANAIVQGWWRDNGGELYYIHVPGKTATDIHNIARRLPRKPDLVIIDYGQQLSTADFKGGKSDSQFVAMMHSIRRCKMIAEDPDNPCVVLLGSQVSGGGDEGWGSAAFRMFAQGMIILERKTLGDKDAQEIVDGIVLADRGEQSVMVKMTVTKANDGSVGSALLYSNGAGFKFEGARYRETKRKFGADAADMIAVLSTPDEAYIKKHDARQKAMSKADLYISPADENKPTRRREASDNPLGNVIEIPF